MAVTKRQNRTSADDICLTPTEAAEWLGVAPHTLANWRVQGRGPAFVRDGRYVAYPIEDLRSYRAAHRVAPRG